MERVISILMNRDGIDRDEAVSLIKECREEIWENPDEADEIISDTLGLEPDYLMDILP